MVIPATAINFTGGTNVTLVAEPSGVFRVFTNDLSTTGFGNARFTFNNADLLTASICIDASPVTGLTGIGVGHSGEVEVPQEIDAQVSVKIDGGPCGANHPNALAAGTNFVFTATDNAAVCLASCVQVIVVGQDRPENNPNTAAFCSAFTGLQNILAEIKSVLGGVNPADSSTFPSQAAVNQLVVDINNAVNAGDQVVPPTVQPQWETATSGLRELAEGLAEVGYDLSKVPEVKLDTVIDDINSPLSGAVAAATTVLTNFFTSSCVTTTVSPLFTG